MTGEPDPPPKPNEKRGFRRAVAAAQGWYAELGTLAKIATAVTAIVGAGTAIAGAYSAIHANLVRHEQIASLIREAKSDLQDQDFAQSWRVDGQALQMAPTNAAALDLQSRIAMRWLENGEVNSMPGVTGFSGFASALIGPLERQAASPSVQGVELADLKAHIGWAHFLQSRDGVEGLRIADEFTDAMKIDPDNMYARVMAGFYILWQNGSLQDARSDFDVAMKSPRDPAYRDRMILAALLNMPAYNNGFAAIDYANQIRKAGRDISADQKDSIYNIYASMFDNRDYLTGISQIVSPEDNIATLGWVVIGRTTPGQWNGSLIKGVFLEQEGKKSEALTLYKAVIAAPSEDVSDSTLEQAQSRAAALQKK